MQNGDTTASLTTKMHSFVKGSLLELCHSSAEILEVQIDGHKLDGPKAGSVKSNETSVWFISAEKLRANSQASILLKNNQGSRKLKSLDLSACSIGSAKWEVVLVLQIEKYQHNGWGLPILAHLNLISAAPGESSQYLPDSVADICLEVSQKGRAPIKRKLLVMSPLIKRTLLKVFLAQEQVLQSKVQSRLSEPMKQKHLVKELMHSENQLEYLDRDSIDDFITAIEAERKDAGLQLSKVRSPILERDHWHEYAWGAWQAAAPSLVAGRLTIEQLKKAGLGPLGRHMVLDKLMLSNETILRVTDVPEEIALRIEIAEEDRRVVSYGSVQAKKGELIWLAKQEELSQTDYELTLARFPQVVVASTDDEEVVVDRNIQIQKTNRIQLNRLKNGSH